MADIDMSDDNNQYGGHIDAALAGFSQGLMPGRFLVGLLPFLRYVPSWVPGAGFQNTFARWCEASAALRHGPFAHVKDAMVRWAGEASGDVTVAHEVSRIRSGAVPLRAYWRSCSRGSPVKARLGAPRWRKWKKSSRMSVLWE